MTFSDFIITFVGSPGYQKEVRLGSFVEISNVPSRHYGIARAWNWFVAYKYCSSHTCFSHESDFLRTFFSNNSYPYYIFRNNCKKHLDKIYKHHVTPSTAPKKKPRAEKPKWDLSQFQVSVSPVSPSILPKLIVPV